MDLTDINEIKTLLSRHGFHFSKALGQNFLVTAWVPENIAEAAGLDKNTGVLEIGPGIGCLTEKLSQRAGKVVSVELDKSLKPLLDETLAECGNVKVIYDDILKIDLNKLAEENFSGLRPVVCANLPYNITSPVLTKLMESKIFSSVTVMIQREMALRICAEAGTENYSAFSLLCRWNTEPEKLFDVPPSCFIPQPKVTSSVITMMKRESPPARVADEKFMFKVIRAAFNQRRKTLANALSSGLGMDKSEIYKYIKAAGLPETVRGEVLNIDDYAKLTNIIISGSN